MEAVSFVCCAPSVFLEPSEKSWTTNSNNFTPFLHPQRSGPVLDDDHNFAVSGSEGRGCAPGRTVVWLRVKRSVAIDPCIRLVVCPRITALPLRSGRVACVSSSEREAAL